MRENIAYTHCTCDMCGDKYNINPEQNLPRCWGHISINYNGYDLCDKCLASVEGHIKSVRKECGLRERKDFE